MATATFTDCNHEYLVDGVVVPSVTQVLQLAGISDVSGIPIHNLERAAAIGTAVHEACQLLDEDDLDFESIDPKVLGYVIGYQKFREETGFKSTLIEHRMIAEVHGMQYGMCVDRVGTFGDDAGQVVLDIKTSARPQPSWSIQTAAYAMGLEMKDCTRAAVHLSKDATYKVLSHHHDEQDKQIWAAALQVANWRLAHGTKLKDR